MTQPITIEDIYKLFQTSQQEADRRFAEADKRAAESKAEADKNMAELERIADQTSKEVSPLSSKWENFIEDFIEPGVLALFQPWGIAVNQTFRRVKSRKQGLEMEVDILATNSEVAILVVVRSRLEKDDIIELIEKIPKFRDAFTAYKNYRIHGAVAAIEFEEHTDRYAYQQGLFVIKQSGKTIVIANDEKFQPLTC